MNERAIVKEPVDERLDNIFHQLLDLYERQAQERQLCIPSKSSGSLIISNQLRR